MPSWHHLSLLNRESFATETGKMEATLTLSLTKITVGDSLLGTETDGDSFDFFALKLGEILALAPAAGVHGCYGSLYRWCAFVPRATTGYNLRILRTQEQAIQEKRPAGGSCLCSQHPACNRLP